MSSGMDKLPIGRVGESVAGSDPNSMDPFELARLYEATLQAKASRAEEASIAKRVSVSKKELEEAVSFWKPIYFNRTVEGRQLNGIEAYELGDPKKTPGTACDMGPYIAMCNLMALEAIRMMGDAMPTAHKGVMLAYASDREREIAKFWKDTFAPTEFQSEWAWTACLGVISGNEIARAEILTRYREQLP